MMTDCSVLRVSVHAVRRYIDRFCALGVTSGQARSDLEWRMCRTERMAHPGPFIDDAECWDESYDIGCGVAIVRGMTVISVLTYPMWHRSFVKGES